MIFDFKKLYEPKKFESVKYSFISSILFSFISYMYLFANNIHNYDNLVCTPDGVGQGITAGRWLIDFLYRLQNIWGGGIRFYNSSTVNTLLAICFMVIACALLPLIYNIQTSIGCIALSAITITTPAVAAAMFFNFTVHIYAFSILLAVLGVYLGMMKKISMFICGSILIACSLGGYQAYLAFAAVLLLLHLIEELYDDEISAKISVLNAMRYLLLLISGYVLYRMILELLLKVSKMTLGSYQGIDEMGKIELAQLPTIITTIYSNMLLLMKDHYLCFSISPVVRMGIALSYFLTLAAFVYYILRYRRFLKSLLMGIYIFMLPIAFDAIELMAPAAKKNSLQSLSLVGIFYLPVLMFCRMFNNDRKTSPGVKEAIKVLPAVIIIIVALNYSYIANINYTASNYKLKVAENFYQTLYNQIISKEGYTKDKKIVLTGDKFQNAPSFDEWAMDEVRYDVAYLDVNVYSKVRFMELYIGETFISMTEKEKEKYSEILSGMSVYPDEDSIRIIDDYAIVKTEDM